MKKIAYILGLISAIVTPSCDVLDLSPEDNYGSGNFWNKESQVENYVIGLHNDLRNDYTMFHVLGETRGGTMRYGTSCLGTSLSYSSPIKDNQLTSDNTGISNWYGLYSNILQVNHFIDMVENECKFMEDSDKAYYLGQAYGLRALYYFMLYRTFGGVPKITDVKVLSGEKPSPVSLYTERSTPEQILTFIKEDIKKSEDYFGNDYTIDKAMWSKYATLMLKSEVYLWSAKVSTYDHKAGGKADLEIARKALEPIMNEYNDKFKLLDDFTNVFADKGNEEVIFAIRFKDKEATNWAGPFIYYGNLFEGQRYDSEGNLLGDVLELKGTVGQFLHEYKKSLWDIYDAEDQRRDKTFMDHYGDDKQNDFGLAMKKGIGIINSEGNRVFETDIIVYRMADALLMMAEIENGLGNPCASYINDVRKRAYGENWSTQYEYVEGNFAQNEMAILRERDKEFVWEGKRWFDVVRLRDANNKSLVFSADANYPNNETPNNKVPLLGLDEEYKLLWPVDIATLNNDKKLLQTPGYGGNEAKW